MHMGRLSVGSVGLFLLASACSSGVDLRAINPRVIRDSSGASFRWVCSQNACKVEMDEATPSPPLCFGERGYYAHLGYRFLVVFPDWDCAQGAAPICESGLGFGRLVVCEHDSDCPQFERFDYICRRGICQDESKEPERINFGVALSLCLWDTPRPTRCTDSSPTLPALLTALDTACSSRIDCPLPLPPSCRQP